MQQPDFPAETSPQNAELFRSIVENVKDYAIFMTDADGRVVSWNPGVERLLGYSESEIVGQPIAVIFTPEDIAAKVPVKEMETAARTGSSEDKRWHQRRDGSRFWANGLVMPLKNADDTLRGFAKVMRDDTAQKLVEDRLEQINQQLENVLSSLRDSFYTLDRDLRYVYVNDATIKMFDLPEADFLGKKLADLFPDVEGSSFHREVARALEEQTALVFENYYSPLDRWFENRVYPSENGLSVLTADITKRKRAEAALRESETRYHVLFDSIDEGFCVIEMLFDDRRRAFDYRFLEMNPSFERLTGISADEALRGKTARELVPHLEEKWFEIYGRVALTGEPVRFVEGSEALNAWFDVYALRVGEAESRKVALLFNNITGRKQAEESLKHQKNLLEALTESVLDGILIVSPEGKILHFNRRFLDIWNFPAEVVESQSDERALAWAAEQTMNPQAFLERVSNVYEQPDKTVREELPMKDGRVYERFGAPILDGETRLGWVWTFHDITESSRTKTNLAFLAEISQDLAQLNGVDEIMQICGAKIGSHLKLSSCAFVEINEAADEAVITHNWHREDVPSLIGAYPLADYVTGEFQRVTRAGEIFVVRDTDNDSRIDAARHRALKINSFVSVPLIQNGEWKFLLVINNSTARDWQAFEIELIHELTTRLWTRLERARAEDRLRESEEQLRALADSIPQLTWMAEADGFIFWYNRRWYDYTATTPEEMAGWGWQTVHDAETLPNVLERWQASIQTGEPFEMEFPLRRGADQVFRWFLTRVVPLRDSNGRIARWFGTNTDVEELRQARLEAENANRLKDEFLATLSHELRTPLNAILGWSQILQSRTLDATEAKQALKTIERNAKSQSQLIDDILDVSRIITGKLRLDVQAVDLPNVLAAAIDAARPAAEAKSIRLQVLLDPQAGPISGDPDRLQQVIWNLLSNAVKFTPKGGRVQLRLERVNSHVEIVVSDTGRGIEAEFLPHVFDRFRQSDGSMTRRHGGLGLGLAIVRQIVELHGGTVSVESAGAEQGATFTVNLPLLPMRREPASDATRVYPAVETNLGLDCPPELSDLRVLLVDDKADSRDLLNLVLDSCGAKVTTTSSAAEALATIKREKFDVLISDIGMPEEDGFSLIKKIRELPDEQGGDIPAIALTAYARSEDRVQALRAGFQMHIAKPVEPSELIVATANLAGRLRNPKQSKSA